MERAMKELHGVKIEYHADDFGMFPTQSQRILDCYRDGCLNGISVMPNSPWLETAMEEFRPFQKDIAVTVHLNLIEGKSLGGKEQVGLLTDDNGILRASFFHLLLRSYLPGRKVLRQHLKEEFRLQIAAVQKYLAPAQPVRLDGHAHYHMIPVAFDALMDVIEEEKLNVSYIRIPREYLSLYLRHKPCRQGATAINLVKVGILNLLSLRNQWKYRKILSGLEKKIFMGVFLSGRMDLEHVAPTLADACALAERRGCGLEILAHPGGVYEPEDIRQLTHPDDVQFLTSEMRRKEASLFQISHEVMKK